MKTICDRPNNAPRKCLEWKTPADIYFGRGEQILKQREEIKRKTLFTRRLRHETENA